MMARVHVGRSLIFKLEASLLQSMHDLHPMAIRYKDVVGEVGSDEKDRTASD